MNTLAELAPDMERARRSSDYADYFGRTESELVDWFATGKAVDLGCGKGEAVNGLREAGVDIVGLDLYGQDDGIIYGGSFQQMPFANGTFNRAVSVYGLLYYYLEGKADWLAGIQEIARILQPGGRLLATAVAAQTSLKSLTAAEASVTQDFFLQQLQKADMYKGYSWKIIAEVEAIGLQLSNRGLSHNKRVSDVWLEFEKI